MGSDWRPAVGYECRICAVDYTSQNESRRTKKEGLVRYQVSKTNGGPSYHEWPAAEFVGRMAALVPPARKYVVRYYGALGPRSPLGRAERGEESSQADPRGEWEGRQAFPSDWPA